MMKCFIILLALFVCGCVAPPVNEKKKDKEHPETNEIDSQAFDVEYKRYLQEVVNILEGDEEFRNRLLKADPDDIKSGKISRELEFVNHNVRSKLDELKRQEMERLRQAAVQQYEQSNGIDKKHLKIPGHLDPRNPHTFESEDLRKLIIHTTKELEDADRKRQHEFKEYEMQKELQYQEQLKHLDEAQRKEAEKQHQNSEKKHKEHQPLHHPGSKQQLEQVWEEQDHLSPEDFNPKTFFHLHDLDGNGVWDANEVKALFKKELDKMYDQNAPEDDIRERYEEMERMREHVFNESDTNKDMLISYDEFLAQTKKQEFEKDEGWKGLDEAPVYSQDEYKEYARDHEEEIRRMIDQGLIPQAPPGYVPMVVPPGQHFNPQQPQHVQPIYHDPQGMHGGPQQHHPNAGYHPQGGQQMNYQQPPPPQYHQQQQQGQYQQQHHPDQQQYHQGQQQHHPDQQQQHHPGQQQYHPGQQPPQPGQYHPPGQQYPPQHQGQPIPPHTDQHAATNNQVPQGNVQHQVPQGNVPQTQQQQQNYQNSPPQANVPLDHHAQQQQQQPPPPPPPPSNADHHTNNVADSSHHQVGGAPAPQAQNSQNPTSH